MYNFKVGRSQNRVIVYKKLGSTVQCLQETTVSTQSFMKVELAQCKLQVLWQELNS